LLTIFAGAGKAEKQILPSRAAPASTHDAGAKTKLARAGLKLFAAGCSSI
jgi:hypothetical protein